MELELNQTQKEIIKLLDKTGADNMEIAFTILNLTKENQRLSDINKTEIPKLKKYILEADFNNSDFQKFENSRYNVKSYNFPFYYHWKELVDIGISIEEMFAFIREKENELNKGETNNE